MGSSSKAFTYDVTYFKHEEAKMKTTFFLILIVALMTANAAPFPQLTKPGLKEYGKNKFVVGAAIAGAGLLTGNQGIAAIDVTTPFPPQSGKQHHVGQWYK